MSLRVRCSRCQTAFITAGGEPGGTLECPKCGARHRITGPVRDKQPVVQPASEPEGSKPAGGAEAASVFVASESSRARSARKRWLLGLAVVALLAIGGVAALVFWPRVKPRKLDPVEKVAQDYLEALTRGDVEAQKRLSTVEEPPAIRSFQAPRRDRKQGKAIKGSFAPIAQLHKRIEAEFSYDPAIGRFTPKHPLGAAAETLDAVHAAKEKAEKSGVYEKMASGDPDDIFDAAESFGKVFSDLAAGALAPKRILPTYKMLVEESKPPIPETEKELALAVADEPKVWDALLKRPFHTLKPDGPFIYDRAVVNAQIWDQLGSLGDPPTTLRLALVRFRLEGIDTGWRVTSAERVLPGKEEPRPSAEPVRTPSLGNTASP